MEIGKVDVHITAERRPRRRPFRERTRCPKCDESRKHTVTTFSGTPHLHVYQCGTTFSVEGVIDQHKRCKKRQERNNRQGNHS